MQKDAIHKKYFYFELLKILIVDSVKSTDVINCVKLLEDVKNIEVALVARLTVVRWRSALSS